MHTPIAVRLCTVICCAIASLARAAPSAFVAPDVLDYTRTSAEIPMRDGVKLHTLILRPKALLGAQPMILERTPYNAESFVSRARSTSLASALGGRYDTILQSGYILVFQDVRGKYGSGGEYVLTRPLRGPLNQSATDHSTDAWDTIEWLVHNVPQNNGHVGMIGISYDGWTTLMALVDPHPALKAAVPIDPLADGWTGDDWFHHGAFRAYGLDYVYDQSATRANDALFVYPGFDEYTTSLRAVSSGARGSAMGMDQLPLWRALTSHPNYDAYWQAQAMDKILSRRGVLVPTLLVHSLFDQEDIYGATAVYAALAPTDPKHERVFLAIGPWFHGQSFRGDGSHIGDIEFSGDTGLQFRRTILQPFLDSRLKDGASPSRTPPVYAYETGSNVWRSLPTWPLSCARDCFVRARPMYLKPGGVLGFEAATSGPTASYVSDPARPVPYVPRPVRPPYQDIERWRGWLVSDQRHASARPDVLVFQTPPLTAPLRIAGAPMADLTVSTTGTDGDFVVKLIDVYPDEVPSKPELGGYEMMISADILRGRFRNDPARPEPFVAGRWTKIRFALPSANHVFLPGHRIMVQVQSSWFPLYDRNPQRFVPNIFYARAADHQAATIRLRGSGPDGSRIDLPIVPMQ